MSRWAGSVAAALAGIFLAGCAATPAGPNSAQGGAEAGRLSLSPAEARQAVPLGRTREQVAQALGPAASARFASGHEVWLYRFDPPGTRLRASPHEQQDPGELVLLFGPDGRLIKQRLRAAGGA